MKTNRNAKISALLCGALISVVPMASMVRAQDAPPPAPPKAADATDSAHNMKPGGPGGQRPGGNPLEMLTKRLDLTEEQKAKIKPIIDEAAPQLKAIHEEAMAKMKTAMDGVHEKIKPILTPDQQAKLEEFRKQMENSPHMGGPGAMGGMNGHGGKNAGPNGGGPALGGRGGNPGERLIKELNLTPDQQTQVKPIMEDTRSQLKAIWEDTTLTPDQKKAKGKEIREANNAKIKALLTPEQQQKMEQIRKEHGPGPAKEQ